MLRVHAKQWGLGENGAVRKSVVEIRAKKSTLVLLDAALCAPPTEGPGLAPFLLLFSKIPEVFMSRRICRGGGCWRRARRTPRSAGDDNGDATGARRVRRAG